MEIKAAIQLLELNVPITKAALKKAYRDALMVWHPDRFVGNTELKAKAEGRTCQINEAYALLSRIPESDYPYRVRAEAQKAKQQPSSPEWTNTSPPPETKSQKPDSAPHKHSKTATAKKKPDILTIAAWIICVPAGVILIAFFSLLQSPKESASQVSTGPTHVEKPLPDPSSRFSIEPTIEELLVRAQQGDKVYQYQLGKAYLKADGVAKNEKESARWFRAAAEQGLAEAQYELAKRLTFGEGISQDKAAALMWYHKAADQNLPQAQFELGTIYQYLSIVYELPRDDQEAVKWYRKAADQGDPHAQCQLGLSYANGEGVKKDAAEAVKWYRKAAAQGDPYSALPANVWPVSETAHAASQARYLLGQCYLNGEGVEKDVGQAIVLLRKAIDQNHDGAMVELGLCFQNGTGVRKDLEEAVRWFRKAVDQGELRSREPATIDANLLLGVCYANGDGVTKNLILGHMWLNVARARGNVKAKSHLLIIEAQMTEAQIAEALSLAANYQPIKNDVQSKKVTPLLAAATKDDIVTPILRHLPSDKRLLSGSLLTDHLELQGGKGKLTLDNGLTEDAYVKMIHNENLVASFYVRGGERFTFDHVSDGVYKLIYCTGFGWDAVRRDFVRGRHAVRYDEPLDFLTTKRTEGNSIITSTGVITLTLHRVANGNTSTSDISLEEFDRY